MTETNKDTERGTKRGVLATGRAKDLDTEDAAADDVADTDEEDDDAEA